MSTLAESFLADLDALSDAEDDRGADAHGDARADGGEDGTTVAGERMMGGETLRASDDVDDVSTLRTTERYREITSAVDEALRKRENAMETTESGKALGAVDRGAEALVMKCNALTVEVDNEIAIVHRFIKDKYKKKFPELESLVLHPIDYARVVKAIGNETDIMGVDLDGVLPSATIMVVSVTGSTTSGVPLSESDLEKTLIACDRALELDESKKKMFNYVATRMADTAPNLSAVLGSDIAAQLIGIAGGLHALSKMPACNVQVLGSKKKNTGGMSSASAIRSGDMHAGYIYDCDIIQKKTPPAWRSKAARLIGAKCTLMARVDAFGQAPDGSMGQKFAEEIIKKIEKWQEPPPARTAKPLPAPGIEAKKRRGGKRARALKERYGITDMRKAANRVNFNEVEEVGYDGEGLGLLGSSAGSAAIAGRLRLQAKAAKLIKTDNKGGKSTFASTSGTAGTASSLAFTPIQGIELVNPNRVQSDGPVSGTDSVFSERRGFSNVARQLKR
ncbi:Prp31 C-terminal [Ostreococcus tauri]|uniref:Prp31 C-terminal n=1 Tax=Ostreococcus tauri TaxID=70448 RepID=A0A090M5W5_OSTTA|nr:Prp31 C-terminal [Ostreococcus tauri]CEF97494.1 Prp31 C-terminal [Ostreococcus tauri]|eukprot:XP_003075088.1 Prp31 C-terminal [Ostreococcus tauri]